MYQDQISVTKSHVCILHFIFLTFPHYLYLSLYIYRDTPSSYVSHFIHPY